MKNSVKVYYVDLSEITDWQAQVLMEKLPLMEKQKLLGYQVAADRLRGAVGKHLLQKILFNEGYAPEVLQQIQVDAYQRPYLSSTLDFNLSHSGKFVIAAIGFRVRLGIDVEEIREINPKDFTPFFTPNEMAFIQAAPQPLSAFYALWTQKEAVLKGNGKGLHLPLEEVRLEGTRATCEQQKWYLSALKIHDQYACHLAVSEPHEISCSQLELRLSPSYLEWIQREPREQLVCSGFE